MSYESFLDSELALAGITLESGEHDRLVEIFKIVDEQGHSGGSLSILLPMMQNLNERELKAPSENDPAKELFNADNFSDGMLKPVFQALNGLTLDRAIVVAEIALSTLQFTPLSPLSGADDEWFEACEHTLQSKRFSALFKDPETGEAYWLDANHIHYPSQFNDNASWQAFSRRGFVTFPFVPADFKRSYYYTTESLRHHVVNDQNPNRQFLTQTMLTTAAGGLTVDTMLNPLTETVGPDVGASLIAAFKEIWEAVINSEELANAKVFPYVAHHVALSALRHAAEYYTDEGKPENVKVFGLTVPHDAIPHLARMVSFVPDSVYLKDGNYVHPYDDNLSGQFVAVPVETITEDSTGWVVLPDLVSVIWNDKLVTTKRVDIVNSNRGVEIISGDRDDWLWNFRENNGIPHPERKSVALADAAADPVASVDGESNYTDPAEPIDNENSAQ